MDLLSTSLAVANAQQPQDRIIDGVDLIPVFTGQAETVRNVVFYFRSEGLFAVWRGPWKAHFITQSSYVADVPLTHEMP